MRVSVILSCAAALFVTGCTIPREGALKSELQRGAAPASVRIMPIDEALVRHRRVKSFGGFPDNMRGAPVMKPGVLAPGDRLGLVIIEGSGRAVPSAIAGRLDIDRLDVDPGGKIKVPFAGVISVAGRQVEEVSRDIEARLRRMLYEPQVQLHLEEQPNRSASIVGAVRKGGAYTLGPGLSRIADLIGAAGVETDQPGQVHITLRRASETGSATLKALFSNSADNVALRPGDVITVTNDIRHVTIMGAVALPGRVEISGEDFSILDALAQARGLDGKSADPSGVFLFPGVERRTEGGPATVYSVDIRDPVQVLLARELRLADGDLVYVSTASFAQTAKVIDAISRGLMPLSRVPSL